MIKLDHVSGVAIFLIEARRLDATTATAFHIEAADLFQAHESVVLDLTPVEFMDSTGIGALVGATKGSNAAGRIAMCGLSPEVETIFQLLRMDLIFPIAETRSEAIELIKR